MDKALKQRLVGASVLIALAVIVLPMMLGGPPQDGASQSQKIELPPRPDEVSFETRRFPLGNDVSGRTADQEQGGSAHTDRLPEPAGREPEAEDMAAAQPGAGAPEGGPDSGTAGAEVADSRRIAPPKVVVEPTPDVIVRPPAALPDERPAPDGGRYVVQVASLGSDANARRLMDSLRQAGLPVLLDTVESDVGRLNRVRVGPYETESGANDAIRRIRESVDGVRPRLVDLRPDETGPVTNPGDPMVRWVVQVGSFSEPANAEGLVERLRASGLVAYGEAVGSPGSVIHRVRVGPFLNREDALKARQQLIAAHSLEGVVMSED